jgi:hypothetical protein
MAEHLELMIPGEIRNRFDISRVSAEFVGELLGREIGMAARLRDLLAIFL